MSGGQSGGSPGRSLWRPTEASGLRDFKALNPYNGALKPAEIKRFNTANDRRSHSGRAGWRQRENQYSGQRPRWRIRIRGTMAGPFDYVFNSPGGRMGLGLLALGQMPKSQGSGD